MAIRSHLPSLLKASRMLWELPQAVLAKRAWVLQEIPTALDQTPKQRRVAGVLGPTQLQQRLSPVWSAEAEAQRALTPARPPGAQQVAPPASHSGRGPRFLVRTASRCWCSRKLVACRGQHALRLHLRNAAWRAVAALQVQLALPPSAI